MDVVNPNVREIKLNKGFVAIVDADDYERVSRYKWRVMTADRRRTQYARCKIYGQAVLLHRFIMQARPGQIMDHINRDGLDNRKANLRFVTRSQNAVNVDKRRSANATSSYKGVYWDKSKRKWTSRLMVNGKALFRRLPTEEEAARAYDEMAREHYGEYAQLNFEET